MCHPINYSIVFRRLETKKDFDCLFGDFDYLFRDSGNLFRGLDDLFNARPSSILILFQLLPGLNVWNFMAREGKYIACESLFKQQFDCCPGEQISISREEFADTLKQAKCGHYMEFIFRCNACHNGDTIYQFGHSMLIYKKNERYAFFDPNTGISGLCMDTGMPDFTSVELYEKINLAANAYINLTCNKQPSRDLSNLRGEIMFIDATAVLEQVEKFYDEAKSPNTGIVEISVDKKTGKLLFSPVLP